MKADFPYSWEILTTFINHYDCNPEFDELQLALMNQTDPIWDLLVGR